MWLKILSVVVQVAKATGLDRKVKDWVLGKLHKAEDKAVKKIQDLQAKVDAIKEKLEG
jgi:ABC-type Fe3+-hydroxamate transport system substrate-binding protein